MHKFTTKTHKTSDAAHQCWCCQWWKSYNHKTTTEALREHRQAVKADANSALWNVWSLQANHYIQYVCISSLLWWCYNWSVWNHCPECSVMTPFCWKLHSGYPRGSLVPVSVDCDIKILYFFTWPCFFFFTVDLYYRLLDFKMCGIYSSKAKCLILQFYEENNHLCIRPLICSSIQWVRPRAMLHPSTNFNESQESVCVFFLFFLFVFFVP